MGWLHDLELCELYSVGPSNKVGISDYYSYIEVELENSGGIILLALCAGIIVHTGNLCGKMVDTPKLSLIAKLALRVLTLFIIFSLFKPAHSLFEPASISSYFLSFFP